MKIDSSLINFSSNRRYNDHSISRQSGELESREGQGNSGSITLSTMAMTRQRSEQSSSGFAASIVRQQGSDSLSLFSRSHQLSSTFSQLNLSAMRINASAAVPEGEIVNGSARMAFSQYNFYRESERTQFAANGVITTEDGREIDFSMALDMARDYEFESSLEVVAQQGQMTDPLVLNFGSHGATLSDMVFDFDLDGDGTKEKINFVSGGSGFLAFDKNQDGKINDGTELFGTQTGQGFAELAEYDDDGNGWIDENDLIYDKLSIWRQAGGGETEKISLKEAGVGAIYLGSEETEFALTDDNNTAHGQITRSGMFVMENGEVASAQQLDLVDHNTFAEPQTEDESEESNPAATILGQMMTQFADLRQALEDAAEESARKQEQLEEEALSMPEWIAKLRELAEQLKELDEQGGIEPEPVLSQEEQMALMNQEMVSESQEVSVESARVDTQI